MTLDGVVLRLSLNAETPMQDAMAGLELAPCPGRQFRMRRLPVHDHNGVVAAAAAVVVADADNPHRGNFAAVTGYAAVAADVAVADGAAVAVGKDVAAAADGVAAVIDDAVVVEKSYAAVGGDFEDCFPATTNPWMESGLLNHVVECMAPKLLIN